MLQEELFDPKQVNLPFTIAIIKPDTVLETEKLTQIIESLQQSDSLSIQNMIQRQLTKEEVLNLFSKHEGKTFFNDLTDYMLSGECCVMVLCNRENSPGDPINKWKQLIGKPDPEEAKKSNPNSLRAKYGKSLLKNEFFGSDTQSQANKERKIFNFKLPQRPPEFIDDPYKLSFKAIQQFLQPSNLQHTCINERMDILALYGPIVNWHSIEQCFCVACKPIAREAAQAIKHRIKAKVLKMLKEADIREIFDQLCVKCQEHCFGFTHLVGGRQMQHVLTDNEIKGLAKEINRNQLVQMLAIEKGSTAKNMINKITIEEPKEILYNMHYFQTLISTIDTDYYGRYAFQELQNLILEDRRIRITYWVSKITGRPVDRFPPITALDNTLTPQQLNDPKNHFFTLQRKLPLTLLTKQQQLKHVPLQYPLSIFDKPKLNQMEASLATEKLLHRNLTKVMAVGGKNTGGKEAVTMLRPYNEGRHGTWDNYSCLHENISKEKVGGRFMNAQMEGNNSV